MTTAINHGVNDVSNHNPHWSERLDLDRMPVKSVPWPIDWKEVTANITDSLNQGRVRYELLEATGGFEPSNRGFAVH